VNLSTAKAMERAREVGIRKVVGAEHTQLIRQFMFESFLLNGIAALLAVFIIALLLPYFNQLTGKPLSTVLWNNLDFWLMLGGLFVLGTVLSGLYPAFVLSSFKPVTVLKGNYSKSSGGTSLRKVLVITQFAASVILIIGTFTVYKQLQYMRSQDIGMNIDQTLVVVGPKMVDNDKKWEIFRTFKTEVLRQPAIKQMTVSTNVPGKEIWSANRGFRLNTAPEKEITIYNIGVDYDFIKTFGLKQLAGRSFSEAYGTDREEAILLNETASKSLGFATPKEAVQQKVVFQGDTLTVIGVINNYHQESLKNNLDPVIFTLGTSYNNFYSLKLSTDNLDKTIASIQTKYAQFFPDDPFEYFFLDEFFNQQYREDQQLGQVFALFAGLAIFVACLGLFGLASFTISRRTKEIGVRKVLGAPISTIVYLLSKDFIRLVLLSFIIALPVGYYAIYYWLQNYAFRIGISWELFVLPGMLILLIALLTVSIQTIKAASVNPVKSLRSE
jgi:putative ABC transport system permease protein